MKVGVAKETYPGERRVALLPLNVAQLTKAGIEVVVEKGAGQAAGIDDQAYLAKGAHLAADRREVFAAHVVAQVRAYGANLQAGKADLPYLRSDSTVIGMCDPLGAAAAIGEFAQTGAQLFSLELVPRITRAQAMDVLSSQATIAGYRAVLLAAVELPKMFPMMMTAAGTLSAARVFVIGAGVAGLQAIATARRLGGIVQAYDVRPACREQVESLGGKFVELALSADESEDKGGYARSMGEEFYQKQRELMASVVAESDVVITTAAIPGKPSPRLITAEAVRGMAAGGVIVDLAAERGGNCELSQPDQRVVEQGVVILGPTNLPAETPLHASQMFSNNITKFLLNMIKDGQLHVDMDDEIIRDTLICRDGQVTLPRLRDLLGLEPLGPPASEAEQEAAVDVPGPESDGKEDEEPPQ